jgi:microcystin-dependent protein
MFGGNFAPAGWAFCNGQLIPIDQNPTLFQLIGTTYGGDGQNNFALPDLQSRIPIHVGPGFALGQSGGEETVTLTTQQIPAHSHVPQGFNAVGNQNNPGGGVWANSNAASYYSNVAPTEAMAAGVMGSAGGSQPHDNMVPFLCVNFILSLFGVFPSQS